MSRNICQSCGHYDEDWGCSCPSMDKWFSCPIESMQPENQEKLREMIAWYEEHNNDK